MRSQIEIKPRQKLPFMLYLTPEQNALLRRLANERTIGTGKKWTPQELARHAISVVYEIKGVQ